jgi:hypothetical protein
MLFADDRHATLTQTMDRARALLTAEVSEAIARPACVAERQRSEGARWWCTAHEGRRDPAHTYSFSGRLTDPHTPLNHLR